MQPAGGQESADERHDPWGSKFTRIFRESDTPLPATSPEGRRPPRFRVPCQQGLSIPMTRTNDFRPPALVPMASQRDERTKIEEMRLHVRILCDLGRLA